MPFAPRGTKFWPQNGNDAMKMTDEKPKGLATKAHALLERGMPAILVSVAEARGSTPRDAGAWMAVTPTDVLGTIGGGQLEWLVTGKAREMLVAGDAGPAEQDMPLGPEINQCCGGKVRLRFETLSPDALARLTRKAGETRNHVQIHGAGHTGRALARALALLPVETRLVDVRPESLKDLPEAVTATCLAMPEQAVCDALPGTAFVVLTHSHDLDFLIAAEALCRGDAAYVGMIGSKTKRAVFTGWLGENGHEAKLAGGLTCPIGLAASGGAKIADKRPEVIAALVAAELMRVFSS